VLFIGAFAADLGAARMSAKNTWLRITLAFLAAAALAAALAATGTMPEVASGSNAVAKIGEEIITSAELERGIPAEVVSALNQRRQDLLRKKLDLLIDQRLLAQEAKRRAVTVDQLLHDEALSESVSVRNEEVEAFIAQRRVRALPGNEGELRERVSNYLRLQKTQKQRRSYLERLRAQASVTVHLKP
jgi:hypothetical protein